MRYLLRARWRATPFGLFAGVAPARFGLSTDVVINDEHRAIARVDGEWLAGVIRRLESIPALRQRLWVTQNNLAFVRDGRLVLGCQAQNSDVGSAEPAEISVRWTGPVRAVIATAEKPVRFGDLADKLAAEYPTTPSRVIDELLAELMSRGILVSCLRPPMTATDPFSHLLQALDQVGANEAPGAEGLVDQLRAVHFYLASHDTAPCLTEARRLRASAAGKMAALVAAERPLAVDLRLNGQVTLPQTVGHEAEAVAAALVMLTPHPSGSLVWRDYQHRFLERYGVGALVPLEELLHVDSGLGFPAGYRGSTLLSPPEPALSERDTALLALAQNATARRAIEIVLDDRTIETLAAADRPAGLVQPHTELRCRVHATTRAALDRGDFEIAITGVSRAAGTTTGRFLDLLPSHGARLIEAYDDLPTVTENAVVAQLSGPTVYSRADNVSRSPQVCAQLLPVAENRPVDGVVRLDDLAVTGDAQRLYLISLSQRRPVEPVLFSAVELVNHAHPLLRFLCEIATARAAACGPFSWGAARTLPFLPRVRYQRAILAPATWTLHANDLSAPGVERQDWATALAAWRDQWQVPAAVYLGSGDRRIRLDLEEPAHLHLVRAELGRAGRIVLREAPADSAFGWIDGRGHDIVIPLAATQRSSAPTVTTRSRGHPIRRSHGHLPASDWLYVKLYGHPDRQNVLLTTHLPRLLATWDTEPEWWFLRYHDPEPHLRLRIPLWGGDNFGVVSSQVGAWAGELQELGLIGRVQWDTYYPETGRFGEGATMMAAESVFAADSAAVVVQLAAAMHRGGPHPHVIVAASMVNLACAATGSTSEGMHWLIDNAKHPSILAPARPLRDQAIQLADPTDNWADLRALPAGDQILAAWARRHEALIRYRAHLADTAIAPEVLLADLLHLHQVRMTGTTPHASHGQDSLSTERACLHLARAAALSWTARTNGAK